MYELEVNEKNIIDTIISNVLDRNSSILNILQLIYCINTKCTISIDGEWGTGKTFFIKQVEYMINLLNEEKSEELQPKIIEMRNTIKSKLEEKDISTIGNTRAIYYNACEYDYFEEPIITIIADIIKNNPNIDIENPTVKENIGEKIDKLISSFKFGFTLPNGVGIELQKEKENHKNSILDSIILDKEIERIFKSLLEDLLVEKSNRLIIFIDELDRCKPSFSVNLLEKIKYFFNDDRFIFVFSTNLNQLQYTIEKHYGNNFNGIYYLQKFFDYQLELPKVTLDNYINYQIKLIPLNSSHYMDAVIRDILKYERFNLRDCNKYFELLKLKYDEIKNSQVNLNYFFFIGILFPILLAIKIKDMNRYQKIRNGNGKDDFYTIIMNCESAREFLQERMHIEEIKKEIIDKLYEYIFVNQESEGIIVEKDFRISKNFVNKMNELLSYLGEKIVI